MKMAGKRPKPLRSVAILVAFSLAWATIHSLLASQPAKRWVWQRFGPEVDRWYRAFFAMVASLTLWPIVPLFLFLPDKTLYRVRAPWRWLMRAVQLVAAAGVARSVGQIGLRRLVGLDQLLSQESSTGSSLGPQALETTGLFGCVRHPIFLFTLLSLWLSPGMTVNRLTTYAATTLYLVVGTFLEEQKLVATFGDAYGGYRERVPRLIPRPGQCLRAVRKPDQATG
jgi:protein-S-isoprenylcysteine O-methyltransferase Ste14